MWTVGRLCVRPRPMRRGSVQEAVALRTSVQQQARAHHPLLPGSAPGQSPRPDCGTGGRSGPGRSACEGSATCPCQASRSTRAGPCRPPAVAAAAASHRPAGAHRSRASGRPGPRGIPRACACKRTTRRRRFEPTASSERVLMWHILQRGCQQVCQPIIIPNLSASLVVPNSRCISLSGQGALRRRKGCRTEASGALNAVRGGMYGLFVGETVVLLACTGRPCARATSKCVVAPLQLASRQLTLRQHKQRPSWAPLPAVPPKAVQRPYPAAGGGRHSAWRLAAPHAPPAATLGRQLRHLQAIQGVQAHVMHGNQHATHWQSIVSQQGMQGLLAALTRDHLSCAKNFSSR